MSSWNQFPALAEADILLELYETEPSHVRHVAALADALFTGLSPWHGRGLRERRWLHLAALLHDIGWSQTPTGKGHHKESARLIGEHRWKKLSPEEAALVAQVARYHRKKLPAAGHAGYRALPAASRKTVDLLAAFLRIADALDRTHTGKIPRLTARPPGKDGAIEIAVEPKGDWTAERRMAEEKKDLLERTAGMAVVVVGPE